MLPYYVCDGNKIGLDAQWNQMYPTKHEIKKIKTSNRRIIERKKQRINMMLVVTTVLVVLATLGVKKYSKK